MLQWLEGNDCPVGGNYNIVFILESQIAGRSESYGLVVIKTKTEETEETEEIIDTSGAEKYYISIDDEEASLRAE